MNVWRDRVLAVGALVVITFVVLRAVIGDAFGWADMFALLIVGAAIVTFLFVIFKIATSQSIWRDRLILAFGAVAAVAFIGLYATNHAGTPLGSRTTGDPGIVTVNVGGDSGLRFHGNLGILGQQRSVQGVTPQTYQLAPGRDGIAVANAQKEGTTGHLSVILTCTDGAVRSQATDAAYGVVMVSCP